MDYGYFTFQLEKILVDRKISKNMLCKELDLDRPSVNRYCQNKFQRVDMNFIAKLCWYFDCDINDILCYHQSKEKR